MSFDLWQIKVVMDLVFNVICSIWLFGLIFLERAERDFHVLPYFIMQTVFWETKKWQKQLNAFGTNALQEGYTY